MAAEALPVITGGQEWCDCRTASIPGGRGVFAKVDVPPGTVVLAEEPLLTVAPCEVLPHESWHMAVARCILESKRQKELQERLQVLHPRRLTDLAPHLREEVDGFQVDSPIARKLADAAESAVTEEEVQLVLLKVRLNAFESGLYIELALVNHACFPNCVKFGPGERSASLQGSWCPRSEIVAVREIRAGEEITISYIGAAGSSSSARAALFRKQHLCELSPSPKPPCLELEYWNPDIDVIEGFGSLAELEDVLDEESAGLDVKTSNVAAALSLEKFKEIEKVARTALHPRHIVLCRLYRLISRAARVVLAFSPDEAAAEQLVHAAREVRATQGLFLPSTHCDVAQVAEDLAVGISVLLAQDRARLFAAFPVEYGDFNSAAAAEAALRREANNIRKYYEEGDDSQGPTKSAKNGDGPLVAPAVVVPSAKEDWSIFD
mmetsp:Transcript_40006/g.76717  ORF Transcript_40006/g.76717 Transcript_40006/m.76717 type:complete len:436 (-) Transcript_40006:438-1745(-)